MLSLFKVIMQKKSDNAKMYVILWKLAKAMRFFSPYSLKKHEY